MLIKFIIKDIRKEQRLTLKQLSYKTGISSTHLNDIECNYKMPSLIFVIKIAKALKVNINALYYVERY